MATQTLLKFRMPKSIETGQYLYEVLLDELKYNGTVLLNGNKTVRSIGGRDTGFPYFPTRVEDVVTVYMFDYVPGAYTKQYEIISIEFGAGKWKISFAGDRVSELSGITTVVIADNGKVENNGSKIVSSIALQGGNTEVLVDDILAANRQYNISQIVFDASSSKWSIKIAGDKRSEFYDTLTNIPFISEITIAGNGAGNNGVKTLSPGIIPYFDGVDTIILVEETLTEELTGTGAAEWLILPLGNILWEMSGLIPAKLEMKFPTIVQAKLFYMRILGGGGWQTASPSGATIGPPLSDPGKFDYLIFETIEI